MAHFLNKSVSKRLSLNDFNEEGFEMVNLQKMAGLKVLLVENDRQIREALTKALLDEGCLLHSVRSGAGGLSLLKEGSFDIIISDFSLPGIDGFEFLKIANRYCPESIKIMIVAYGDVDPMSKVFKFGIDDVIEKPFPYESLLYTISKHLVSRGSREKVSLNKSNKEI
jgi:DNA-binding NtrC family response regulator